MIYYTQEAPKNPLIAPLFTFISLFVLSWVARQVLEFTRLSGRTYYQNVNVFNLVFSSLDLAESSSCTQWEFGLRVDFDGWKQEFYEVRRERGSGYQNHATCIF